MFSNKKSFSFLRGFVFIGIFAAICSIFIFKDLISDKLFFIHHKSLEISQNTRNKIENYKIFSNKKNMDAAEDDSSCEKRYQDVLEINRGLVLQQQQMSEKIEELKSFKSAEEKKLDAQVISQYGKMGSNAIIKTLSKDIKPRIGDVVVLNSFLIGRIVKTSELKDSYICDIALLRSKKFFMPVMSQSSEILFDMFGSENEAEFYINKYDNFAKSVFFSRESILTSSFGNIVPKNIFVGSVIKQMGNIIVLDVYDTKNIINKFVTIIRANESSDYQLL